MEINNREIRVKGFHSLVFLHVICVVDCCHNVDWILCLPLLCWLVDSGCIKSSVTSVTYSSEKISMALINISLIGLSGCYRKTRDWMKSCVCSEVGCSLGLELCILGLVCCTQTLTKGWNNIFFLIRHISGAESWSTSDDLKLLCHNSLDVVDILVMTGVCGEAELKHKSS